jgi:hypothetical protein
LKLLEEKIGKSFKNVNIYNFLNRTSIDEEIITGIGKWDFIKLKASSKQKKLLE